MADDQWEDVPVKKSGDGEWEDVAPAKAAPHVGAMPEGSYQNRPKGPILNANESSPHAAVRGLEGTLGINREPTSFGNALGQSASSLGRLGLSIAKDPLNIAQIPEGMATGLEEAGKDVYQGVKRNDPRAVAHGTGSVAGILGPQAEAVKEAEPLARQGIESLPSKSDVGLAVRTEKGAVKPMIRRTAGLAGAALGHASGVPVLGPLIGYGLGEGLAGAVLPERPYDISTKGRGLGAPLPLASDFYENRARDLTARGRQQAILDRAAAKQKTTPFSGSATEAPAILPEPREPMPGDRPGAMWSVGRENVLPEAAERGTPGAGDVLRNIGKPIIYVPREGVGYPGPRTEAFAKSAAQPKVPEPSIGYEDALESARRGAPGIDPVQKSLRRHFRKNGKD